MNNEEKKKARVHTMRWRGRKSMKGNIQRPNSKKDKFKNIVFEKICLDKFRFLKREFDFTLSSSYGTRYGGTFILYQNSTTAVEISLQPREGGVFGCCLIKLIKDEIPPYPHHWFYIEQLLRRRDPSFKIDRPPPEELYKPSTFEKILGQYATAVEKYARDVLLGDFRIFDELEKLVKKRAEESRKERIKGESEQPKEGKHEETN